jgi:DNA-binding NarL/FixJ family response regulator
MRALSSVLAEPHALEHCVNDDRVRTDRERYERLTERERSVLRFVAQGYSASEIGARLSISPKTVDTYKQRIQEKLAFAHRSQYVQFAFRLGLLAVVGLAP